MSGSHIVAVVLICFQVQQAFSLKCYQNFNISDENATPSGKGTETDCSAYPYTLFNNDITQCVKAIGEGYTSRMCDFGKFCSLFGVSNNDCKTMPCDTNITIPGDRKSQTLRSLIRPSNLASDSCTMCCCNKNGCNFAIGPKAFTTLILAGLAFVFLLKK